MVLVLVIMFGAPVLRVVVVFLLFGVVLFVIVVVCGGEDIYFGHCSAFDTFPCSLVSIPAGCHICVEFVVTFLLGLLVRVLLLKCQHFQLLI